MLVSMNRVCGKWVRGSSVRNIPCSGTKRTALKLQAFPTFGTQIPAKRYFGTEIIAAYGSVIETVQTYLQDVHSWSELPWWISIAASTILVRTATFPLVRQQVLVSRKVASAMPDISMLTQLLGSRLSKLPISNTEARMELIQVYMKGVKASLVVHKVNVGEIFLYPLINISIFVTFVLSVRDMVLNGPIELALDAGGAFWFEDLTEKDKTFFLPLCGSLLSYSAVELALSGNQGRFLTIVKDVIQCIILLSVPMVTQLPAGVFCYWIPSSCFGILQSQLLKNQKFQSFFGIPALPAPPTKKL